MNMPRFFIALGSFLLGSGCVVHHHSSVHATTAYRVQGSAYHQPVYVTVRQAPPPLRAEIIPSTRPNARVVWRSGHWKPVGTSWTWVAGQWMQPQPGHEWEPPVCVATDGGGYQYHPGFWRSRDQEPPQIYRTPGTIQVHIRRPNARATVQRVPPNQARATTVVVRSQASSGPSASVVARAPTATTVRATGTIQTQPSNPTVRAAARTPSRTVQAQPSNPTVRAAARTPSRTVQAQPSNPTVRAAARTPSRTVQAQPSNPTVRAAARTPSRTVQAQPSNPTVRAAARTPNRTVQAQPSNPTVRAAARTPSRTVQVQPTNTHPARVASSRPTCAPAAAVTTPGGMLILRGRGLSNAGQVTLAGQPVSIVTSQNNEIRARVSHRAISGPVRVVINGQTLQCGSVRVAGVARMH